MLTQSLYYDCNKIWINGTLSDRPDDNNKEVFDQLSFFLSNAHKKNIEISSPFWGMYKTDVIKWFISKRRNFDIVQVAKELLNNTFSCYYPKDINSKTQESYEVLNTLYNYNTYECMNCPACFRKSVELNSIGIFRNFKNNNIIQKYKNEFRSLVIQTPRSSATLEYIYRVENSLIKK
jgi:diphthamide synthase (EF-2-diphthine--ammonia ligase)